MGMYTLLYLKWITNKNLLYSTWNSAQCYMAAWMGGEFGRERMCMCVCVCGCVCVCVPSHLSCVQLFVTLWTVACQASLSMGFSRQENWSGLPCPPLGYPPNPGIEPASYASPAFQADSLPLSHRGSLCVCVYVCVCVYD